MKIEVDSVLAKHTTIVVGLGKTGLSCARYLAEQGDRVIVTDSRERPPGMSELRRVRPDIEMRLGGFEESLLSLADRLVVSPGVSLDEPFIAAAIRRNLAISGDIDLFAAAADAPVVAVTGSNGKSTVTTLVAAMMRKAGRKVLSGGNIGVPALDLLKQPVPDYYVLELSSFQLDCSSKLAASVGTVLNVTADHLDRHGSLEAYAAAKARVYRNCGVAVYNRDDSRVVAMVEGQPASISFGLDAPAVGQYGVINRRNTSWIARGSRLLMPIRSLRVNGDHNVANVLAAMAVGEGAGLPRDAMLAAAQEFRGLPHRTQWVSDAGGLQWVNDSKGTNVGAAVAAIGSIRGRLVLVAGGDGKGADFAPMAEALHRKARAVVLLGKDADPLAELFGQRCPVRRVASMDEAVIAAAELAEAGDTVLLSPGCSSLDMYASFESRGDAFVAAIRRHIQ